MNRFLQMLRDTRRTMRWSICRLNGQIRAECSTTQRRMCPFEAVLHLVCGQDIIFFNDLDRDTKKLGLYRHQFRAILRASDGWNGGGETELRKQILEAVGLQ